MKTAAHIENGKVINISVWEDSAVLPVGLIDITGQSVSPGDLFTGGVFLRAPIPAPIRIPVIQPDQFFARLTQTEIDALLTLAYNGDQTARRLLLKLQTSAEVDIDSSDVSGWLTYLVSVGVLTPVRVGKIKG